MQINQLKQIEFERRESELENAKKQDLIISNKIKEKLHITYVMTWTGVCGGTKIVLEHANRLIKRGHKITLISHDKKPVWFPMDEQVEFIEVPWEEVLCTRIPKCDLIVTTYWREIYEAIQQKIAPVIYFEQGDYHLFDPDRVDERLEKFIQKQFNVVNFIYTVSSYAKDKIKERFNKDAIVIPNAINDKVFFYKEHPKNNEFTITMIGAESSEFKRIKNIIKALEELKAEGYKFKIEWVTPTRPKENNIDCIVNPPQIEIGNVLRRTDIFICASIYEAFCLPVLEAMTCGAAVITTNNGGNMDFVKNEENALVIKQDDIEDMKSKIKILCQNEELRKKIIKNALKSSEQYHWDNIIPKIEEYYKKIAQYKVIED